MSRCAVLCGLLIALSLSVGAQEYDPARDAAHKAELEKADLDRSNQHLSSRRIENANELSETLKKDGDLRAAIELQRGADLYGAETRCGGEHIRIDRESDDLRRKADHHAADLEYQAERIRINRKADDAIEAVNKQEADAAAAIAAADKRDAEQDAEDAAKERTADEKRLKTARIARKAREAREAKQVALDQIAARNLEEQHQRELRELRANCSAIYIKTADKKVSDLTVREAQLVQACQGVGQYPPR